MAQYSADECQPPNWLNDDFLADILQKSENDPKIRLVDTCKLLPATQAGDHYGSVMFRTTVCYESQRLPGVNSVNLIIKTEATAEGYKKEVAKGSTVFAKEIQMYGTILPAMVKVLEDAGEHLEVPRLFYASLQPNAIIVLEDLSPKGWIANRVCIGSFEEATQAIRNIANFHAASVYLHQQKIMDLSRNSIKEILCEGVVLTQFSTRFEEFCGAVGKWDDCRTFTEKLKIIHQSLGERYGEVYTPNPETIGYNVLNHGDFNWKNLLVKKNPDGHIVDSMMIDYQCCHWGSPAIDVLYLLDLIVDNGTKTTYRNKIIYEYHQQFATVLAKMGYMGRIPSLVDVQVELLRKGFLEVMHVVVFEKFKFEKLTEETFDSYDKGNPDCPCYRDEVYGSVIRSELPLLMHKGLLDQ